MSSVLQQWKKKIKAFFGNDEEALNEKEREFLPAALEVIEAPPSLVSRVITYTMFTLVAIGLFPPLFVRLPGKARVAACALGLPAFVAALGALGYVDKAYERTPKGAQEAKAYAAAAAALSSDRLWRGGDGVHRGCKSRVSLRRGNSRAGGGDLCRDARWHSALSRGTGAAGSNPERHAADAHRCARGPRL